VSEVEEVQDKLDKLVALGTPEAIAMELEAQGIKADRVSASTCAIAQYLGNLPNVEIMQDISVTRGFIAVGFLGTTKLPTPPVVREFISRFDQGEYPALLRSQSL
jgi:hypothetical protein